MVTAVVIAEDEMLFGAGDADIEQTETITNKFVTGFATADAFFIPVGGTIGSVVGIDDPFELFDGFCAEVEVISK